MARRVCQSSAKTVWECQGQMLALINGSSGAGAGCRAFLRPSVSVPRPTSRGRSFFSLSACRYSSAVQSQFLGSQGFEHMRFCAQMPEVAVGLLPRRAGRRWMSKAAVQVVAAEEENTAPPLVSENGMRARLSRIERKAAMQEFIKAYVDRYEKLPLPYNLKSAFGGGVKTAKDALAAFQESLKEEGADPVGLEQEDESVNIVPEEEVSGASSNNNKLPTASILQGRLGSHSKSATDPLSQVQEEGKEDAGDSHAGDILENVFGRTNGEAMGNSKPNNEELLVDRLRTWGSGDNAKLRDVHHSSLNAGREEKRTAKTGKEWDDYVSDNDDPEVAALDFHEGEKIKYTVPTVVLDEDAEDDSEDDDELDSTDEDDDEEEEEDDASLGIARTRHRGLQMSTMHLSNLPVNSSTRDLWEKYSPCGEILRIHIEPKGRNRFGRTYGFIDFKTQDALQKALAMGSFRLHGLDVGTTKAVSATKLVKMKAMRDLKELQKEAVSGGYSFGIFVKALPEDIAWTDVRDAFSRFGEVDSVRMKNILGSRHCFVQMKNAEGRDTVLRHGFVEMGSCTLRVYRANPVIQPAIVRIRNVTESPEEITRVCKRIAAVERVNMRAPGLVDVYFNVRDMEELFEVMWKLNGQSTRGRKWRAFLHPSISCQGKERMEVTQKLMASIERQMHHLNVSITDLKELLDQPPSSP